ncbi:hypothetical protein AMATHDRAFT_72778 [Amanita thiersii Skay4041]|uniref:CRA domain-containing protein n=1 Tax=Amanita thiersii Skay4041 TaxID=703135 RepID=A0A2A9P0Y2_9AGAR|nr:hypothetical protein AMATHDRAFT_72778 [Amanita thiersii Skay4041]
MLGSPIISDILGYTSIACWLGAQFPQLYVNYWRQSCEGLSLPFLLNWFLGDCSNLIGCILTRQLPFQTWLATYFVSVDTTLVIQYFYYTHRTRLAELHKHGYERITPTPTSRLLSERTPSHYRTLSAVAANMATAAALAAQQDEQAQLRRNTRRQRRNTDHLLYMPNRHAPVEDDDNDTVPARLTDSYYSEGGHVGGRKRVSWSIERPRPRGASVGRYATLIRANIPAVLPLSAAEPFEAGLARGRNVRHRSDFHDSSTAPGQRASNIGRRGASLLILSVWALFGVGNYANRNQPSGQGSNTVGRVLSPLAVPVSPILPTELTGALTPTSPESEIIVNFEVQQEESDPYLVEIPNERFLGRIFAWLCTTLYLTSRLPQIWKNYVRKSVEGLSMSLFIFAFLGNVFYVSSILSSPKVRLPPPISTEFIRESIPYLLGSGGTLMFDITIVTQSFIYRPRRRRHSLLNNTLVSEETGLLSGDGINNEALSAGRTSAAPTGPLAKPIPYQLRSFVLDYLIYQCYSKTAKAFLRDTVVKHYNADGDELELPLSSAVDTGLHSKTYEEALKQADWCEEVRIHILSGQIDEAVDLLNERFPNVLSPPLHLREDNRAKDNNSPGQDASQYITRIDYVAPHSIGPAHLSLNLRIQAFIEACRTIPLKYRASGRNGNNEPVDFTQDQPQLLGPSSSDSAQEMEKQVALLSKAQKLYASVNILPNASDREQYHEELKNVAGLLAYKVPEKSPMSMYMSQERREAVAEQITSAILCATQKPVISTLELVVRHLSTVWGYSHEQGIKPSGSALIPPVGQSSTLKNSKADLEAVPPFDLGLFLDAKSVST